MQLLQVFYTIVGLKGDLGNSKKESNLRSLGNSSPCEATCPCGEWWVGKTYLNPAVDGSGIRLTS